MKIIKSNPGIFALIIGVGLAFSTSAFKGANSSSYWQLKPNTGSESYFDASSYEEVDPEEATCPTGESVPCVIHFDTNEYADLDAYLESFNESPSALIAEADATRAN